MGRVRHILGKPTKKGCMPYEEVQHDVAERNNRVTAWTPSHQNFRSLTYEDGAHYILSLA